MNSNLLSSLTGLVQDVVANCEPEKIHQHRRALLDSIFVKNGSSVSEGIASNADTRLRICNEALILRERGNTEEAERLHRLVEEYEEITSDFGALNFLLMLSDQNATKMQDREKQKFKDPMVGVYGSPTNPSGQWDHDSAGLVKKATVNRAVATLGDVPRRGLYETGDQNATKMQDREKQKFKDPMVSNLNGTEERRTLFKDPSISLASVLRAGKTVRKRKLFSWEKLGCSSLLEDSKFLSFSEPETVWILRALCVRPMNLLKPIQVLEPPILSVPRDTLISWCKEAILGSESEGFTWNEGRLVPLKNICYPGVTPEAVQHLLEEFASIGTSIRALRSRIQTTTHHVMHQAAAIQLNKYFLILTEYVSSMQTSPLIELRSKILSLEKQIQVLSQSVDENFFQRLGINLLSHIYASGQNTYLTTPARAVLMSLLVTTCAPYFNFLREWLFSGLCLEGTGFFGIRSNMDSLELLNQGYWLHGFSLMPDVPPGNWTKLRQLEKKMIIPPGRWPSPLSVGSSRRCETWPPNKSDHPLLDKEGCLRPRLKLCISDADIQAMRREVEEYAEAILLKFGSRFTSIRERLDQTAAEEQAKVEEVHRVREVMQKKRNAVLLSFTLLVAFFLRLDLNLASLALRFKVWEALEKKYAVLLREAERREGRALWQRRRLELYNERCSLLKGFAEELSVLCEGARFTEGLPEWMLDWVDRRLGTSQTPTDRDVDINANLSASLPASRESTRRYRRTSINSVVHVLDRNANLSPAKRELTPPKLYLEGVEENGNVPIASAPGKLENVGQAAQDQVDESDTTQTKATKQHVSRKQLKFESKIFTPKADQDERSSVLHSKDFWIPQHLKSLLTAPSIEQKTETPRAFISRSDRSSFTVRQPLGIKSPLLSPEVNHQQTFPPFPVLLETSLSDVLKTQIKLSNAALLNHIFVKLDVLETISVLRDIYFFRDGCFGLRFSEVLFSYVNTLDSVRLLEVPGMPQQVLDSAFNNARRRSLPVKFGLVAEETMTSGLAAFGRLHLRCEIPWPLNIVIDDPCLRLYDRIFGFIARLKHCNRALDDLFIALKRDVRRDRSSRMAYSPSYRKIQQIRMSMLHFIRCLEDYVITNVFHSSWYSFIEAVRNCVHDLDELILVHRNYLDVVATQCLQVETSSRVLEQLYTVLESILHFYMAYGNGTWEQSDDGTFVFSDMIHIQAHYSSFHRCVKYLLAVIEQCEVRARFDFLNALAIRLDFHGYYSSEPSYVVLIPAPDQQQYNGDSRIPPYNSPGSLSESVDKLNEVPPNPRRKPQSLVEKNFAKDLKRLRQGGVNVDDDEEFTSSTSTTVSDSEQQEQIVANFLAARTPATSTLTFSPKASPQKFADLPSDALVSSDEEEEHLSKPKSTLSCQLSNTLALLESVSDSSLARLDSIAENAPGGASAGLTNTDRTQSASVDASFVVGDSADVSSPVSLNNESGVKTLAGSMYDKIESSEQPGLLALSPSHPSASTTQSMRTSPLSKLVF
ncbi:unnamed protein product [Cyprideis torosa]|uniref:Uncharacterized protein n=1 Tax=Cyprideis torosa TaxID=163714 RepID=A0A7R8W5T8_9CRUS|nr:unnamed protein product [Cyprideis torosa]CAG0881795.1 unnamed protein product [Cyprideis torosa]